MVPKSIEAVSKADIDALITNKVAESKTLEYKEILPGNSDGDKKELLADISSFANASGGDLIYGIKAAVDANGKKNGEPDCVVPLTGITPDQAKLRLEQTIQAGVTPRLRVQIKEIGGFGEGGKGFIILVRVPQSFAAPHMVSPSSRFYSRHSAGKYQLDVGEIRNAFLASESQTERIRSFRTERLARIMADETPVPLASPHRIVVHVIPLDTFLRNARLDFSTIDPRGFLYPIGSRGFDYRYNVDGFLTWEPAGRDESGSDGYCQLFFNGAIEAVYADVLRSVEGRRIRGGQGFIASVAYEKYVADAVRNYMGGLQSLSVVPPVVVCLSLLGCKGSHMFVHPRRGVGVQHAVDRDIVVASDVTVEEYGTNVYSVLRPLFDVVWNACGYPSSLNYDAAGNWVER